MKVRLAAVGIAAAALVAGAAVTVGYGLSTGFERAARQADLPDVIARFDPELARTVDARVRGLPNLRSRSYRYEVTRVPLRSAGASTDRGVVHLLLGGRRGYDVVAGRDLSPRPGEVVVERGVARALRLAVGDRLRVGRRLGDLRVVGIASSPDNVAYPLARTARVYIGTDELRAAFPRERGPYPANLALLWTADPERTDVTLAQARTVAFGLGDLRFVTRTGVRLVIDQAAGVVIALLSAFALVALVAAGTMLAAGAHADVQRRLPALGVRRALGATPGAVTAGHALAALRVAAPAGALGIAAGAAIVGGPASDLLDALNERGPGVALLAPLLLAWAGVCAVVTGAATVPAWRAARRPIAPLLRGGDGRGRPPERAGRGGLARTGARFAVAARARWAGSVLTLAVCAAVVLLMLALASLLVRLRDDPTVLGKRYQLTVGARAGLLASIRAVDGVEAATQRYDVEAADAFRLGEPVRLIAYRGDHTRFEAPPLAAGRRIRGPGEVEVGSGLAEALGLRPGARLATLSPGGAELRLTVVGVVRALERNGRVGWVSAPTLRRAEPGLEGRTVIRLAAGADRARVLDRLRALDVRPVRAGGATTRDTSFLGLLAGVLRAVALAVGLVCLYALVQGLAMTARERRRALAVLRACGASRRDVAAVLAGAGATVAVPAAVLAVALEVLVLGPAVSRLAAGYAGLPLAPSAGQVALVLGGVGVLAAAAAALVARRLVDEPVVRGLREELP